MLKDIRIIACIAALAIVTAQAQAQETTAVVGKPAPEFTATDSAGKTRTLAEFKGKLVVLEWVNYDCPFVKKHYGADAMQALQRKYTEQGVVWLSINSSASGKQGNYPAEKWAELVAERKAAPTAVLLDTDGKVGRLYGAKTTPHMFIVNAEGTLIYAGAIDNNPSPDPATLKDAVNYVAKALDAALAGKPVETATSASYGCSVKY